MKLKSTADLGEQAELCDDSRSHLHLFFPFNKWGKLWCCHKIAFICSDGDEANSCFITLTCNHTNTMGPDMLAAAAHYRFHHPPGSWLQVKCGGLVPSRQEKKEREKETIGLRKKGVIKISMWNFHRWLWIQVVILRCFCFSFKMNASKEIENSCYQQSQPFQQHFCISVFRISLLISQLCKTK